ncbi:MAG: PIN domain nuclease [Anaerolinea sp.]|nr:PIN domain nuclease [Anaerolinea sp.]
MMISDSNLIIYAASRNYPALMDWFAKNKPAASAISLVEVLGYHKLQDEEKRALEAFFTELTILYPTPEIFQTAIELRQQRAMSLGDALVAGTAVYHGLTLATHNTKDFERIKLLKIVDPLQE